MKPDPASLDNLRDIVEPPPIPWWPPAVGWWVLLGLVVVMAAVVGLLAWRKWRAGAYRRAALSELESAHGMAAIAETLKRTALAAFPRTDVAALSILTIGFWGPARTFSSSGRILLTMPVLMMSPQNVSSFFQPPV